MERGFFFVCPAALCCRFRSEAAWQRRHPPCLWCVPGPCPAVGCLQSVQWSVQLAVQHGRSCLRLLLLLQSGCCSSLGSSCPCCICMERVFSVCPAALCCRFRSEVAWQRRHPPCLVWCVSLAPVLRFGTCSQCSGQYSLLCSMVGHACDFFSFCSRAAAPRSGRHVHAAFAWKGFFLCAQLPCAAGSGLKLPGRGGILPVLSGVCPWPLSCGSVLAVGAVVSTACCAAWSVMLATSSPFAVGLLLLAPVVMCMLHLHVKGFFCVPSCLVLQVQV
ncbi:hypothetical protein COO60DRAFT_286699 [Scenedesmus sp. NREL 46B-D3]|nr:hypothetical protein COO60DRAFT_286699 [Scenedesmus sp. NREL 46B-D3]